MKPWSYDLGANFYLTPNLRVWGGLGFIDVESGGVESEFDTISLHGEYQPFAAPVSVTLGWSRIDLDGAGESESTSIGVRWSFGAGTLRDRDNITPFTAATGLFARLYGVGD